MKKNKDISLNDYITHGLYFLLYGLVKYIPSPIGDIFRFIATKPFIKSLAGWVRIYEGVTFWYPYKMMIGKNVTLNEWVYLSGFGSLVIGNNVRIGHRTSIITSDHEISDRKVPIYKQGIIPLPVIIEDDVWIGCNVTILGGTRIGRGAVIGAGAVVTQDIEPYTVAIGIPAKPVKYR
ncbi:MAG: acyltransferase [Bacillota bacterium]